jgi:hypothetical protein
LARFFEIVHSLGYQGAFLRLLGAMVWLPTSFLDERYVTWAPLDERRATATLRVGGDEVGGVYEFGEDWRPTAFPADRYRDLAGGRRALTRHSGRGAVIGRAVTSRSSR